jgi:hypothetical protein
VVKIFTKKFYLRLRAMPPSVKFKLKIFLPTLRYAAQRGVHSALCRIAESFDSALCRIAGSDDSALCGIAGSQHIFAYFSANSQPYAKMFLPVYQWPKWDRFMKKTEV